MRLSFKYFCASFLILISGMMYAQNDGYVILDVDYSVAVSESAGISGNAVVTFGVKSFRMAGNGVESYCDGSAIWTLDMKAREVYIEAVTPEIEAYMLELGPQLATLKPSSETSFVSPDGQEVRIKVNSIKKTDGKDVMSFRPPYDFDSSWVVTDLR